MFMCLYLHPEQSVNFTTAKNI